MRIWLTLMAFCTLWTLSSGAKADIYKEVNALVQAGQWKAAQSLADERLKTSPTDPQMRLLKSHIQTGMGQFSDAADTLRALTLSFPELPEPHNNLAALLARENRHEEALSALNAAIRARPDYALALENMGDLYLALATKAYAQALRVSPSLQRLQNKQTLTENILKAP
ncbi:MAG: tetratricopeptide repeat protein [Limnohabitans sp.]|jgi:tetratricopeptide (TPR) repeat protein